MTSGDQQRNTPWTGPSPCGQHHRTATNVRADRASAWQIEVICTIKGRNLLVACDTQIDDKESQLKVRNIFTQHFWSNFVRIIISGKKMKKKTEKRKNREQENLNIEQHRCFPLRVLSGVCLAGFSRLVTSLGWSQVGFQGNDRR